MIKENAEKKNISKSLFFKTYLSVFLVFFVAILSLLLIYLNSSRKKLATEYTTLIQTSISSIDQSFSQNLKDITNLGVHLYSTVQGTRARLQEKYSAFDLSLFSSDIRDMYQVLPNIHSVTVLTKNNKEALTVTNPTMGYYPNNFGDKLIENYLEMTDAGGPYIFEAAKRHQEDESYKLLNIFFRNAEPDSSLYSGTLIISIDTETLSRFLFDTQSSNPVFYILNKDGYVIAHNSVTCCGENWSNRSYIHDIIQEDFKSGKVTDGDRTFDVFAVRSSMSGYYIVAESDSSFVASEKRSTSSTVLIGILLLGSFCILLLYYILEKLFRPLNMAVEEIKTSPMFRNDEADLDDVALISTMSKRSEIMIEELKEKDNRNIIVKDILKNQEVDHLLYNQNYLYRNGEHLIILVHIGREQAMEATMTSYDTYRNEICADLTEKLNSFGKVVSFEFGFRRMMYIISNGNRGNISQESIAEELQKFSIEADKENAWKGTFYISQIFSRETDNTCTGIFVHGESVIKTRRKLEPEYQKIVICEDDCPESTKAACEALYLVTRRGNHEEYLETAGHLVSIARNLPWEDFTALIVKVSRTVTKIRYPEKKTEDVENKTLRMLSNLEGRENLVNWLIFCYEDDSIGFQTVDNDSPMPVLERAINYIENHYQDNNLNLSYLAAELHISSPYLGKLFREFTGETFNDYLLKKRMVRAGELLVVKRDASVTSIAEEVGYSNSAYFTTSFKNYFGMTPKKYRYYSESKGEEEQKSISNSTEENDFGEEEK